MDEHTKAEQARFLQTVANGLDKIFNGEAKGDDRPNGFVLLVFPFDKKLDGSDGQTVNYVSNAERGSVMSALTQIVERNKKQEGTPDAQADS